MSEESTTRMLIRAAYAGDIGAMRSLVADGANIHGELRDAEFEIDGKVMASPLEAAAAGGNVVALAWLIDAGCDPSGRDVPCCSAGWPLFAAVAWGNRSAANLLVARGASLEFPGAETLRPRMVAWGLEGAGR